MKTSSLQRKDANWSGTGTDVSQDHRDWPRLSYRETVQGRRRRGRQKKFLLLLLLRSPAVSLGFTIFSEIFAYVTIFQTYHWGSHIPSSWKVHVRRVFVAGIHPSRTWMSESFESVQWNACVHKLDLGLHSHPKEFWGNGVRTHVNSKGKIPSTGKLLLREGSNLWHCITQQQQAHTLPKSYSSPRQSKRWEDNIKEWTGLEWNSILWKAENRKEWRKLVVKSTMMPQQSDRLRDRWR